MTTLIVAAHPDPESLTIHLARRLEAALKDVEVADLAAESFDPRFMLADRESYRSGGDFSADVAAEQQRIERATDLVLVFPVYWWSMPALLKGWIDRVFVNGWAFEPKPDGGMQRNLDWLRIHLVPIAGDDAGVYERHGYEQAIRTQIEHGLADYCGARRGATVFVFESEQDDAEVRDRDVERVVTTIVEATAR